MKKIIAFVAIATVVVACAPQTAENYSGAIAAAVPASPEIKAQIVRDARDLLRDPYGVRDAEISNVATFSNGGQGVCVKANTKNAYGGFIGRQTMAINIRNGLLSGHTMNSPLCARPDVKYFPFPELEALKNL